MCMRISKRPLSKRRKMKKTLDERFRAFYSTDGDGCWEWHGHRNTKGYGKFAIPIDTGEPELRWRITAASRFAWELANGPIPSGLEVMHSCDNPPCVRLSHLSLGTHTDNMRDKMRKGRDYWGTQTHCKRGHEFTPENTGQRRDHPGRICKACKAALLRESRRLNRLALLGTTSAI